MLRPLVGQVNESRGAGGISEGSLSKNRVSDNVDGVKHLSIFCAPAVLIFLIAQSPLLHFKRVHSFGSVGPHAETGFFVPSGYNIYRTFAARIDMNIFNSPPDSP
jgi:hypothetical protein